MTDQELQNTLNMNRLEMTLIKNDSILVMLTTLSLIPVLLEYMKIQFYITEMYTVLLFVTSICWISVLGGMFKIYSGIRSYIKEYNLKFSFHSTTLRNAFYLGSLTMYSFASLYDSVIGSILAQSMFFIGFIAIFFIRTSD